MDQSTRRIKKVGVDIDKDRRPVIGHRPLLGSSTGGRFLVATQAPSLDAEKKLSLNFFLILFKMKSDVLST
jgi:hypothetical protein